MISWWFTNITLHCFVVLHVKLSTKHLRATLQNNILIMLILHNMKPQLFKSHQFLSNLECLLSPSSRAFSTMASKEQDVATSSISPVLFMTLEGRPMSFYLRPGPVKVKLQPLITAGGGNLCNVQKPGAILLMDPTEEGSISESTVHWYVSRALFFCTWQLMLCWIFFIIGQGQKHSIHKRSW